MVNGKITKVDRLAKFKTALDNEIRLFDFFFSFKKTLSNCICFYNENKHMKRQSGPFLLTSTIKVDPSYQQLSSI